MYRLLSIAVGLLLLLAFDASARTGTLRTLTGAVYEGNVTLSPLGGLLINLNGGGTAMIPLAFLVNAKFEPSAMPATNSIHRWVVFRNGSVQPVLLVRGTESEIYLEGRGLKFKASPLDVAGIICQPGNPSQWPSFNTGRTGVALKNGDFMDGTFHDMDNSYVGLNTVIFGYRRILLDRDVAAVVLHALMPAVVRYQLYLADGSVYGSKILPAMTAGDMFVIADPVLGETHVPFNTILEFKILPAVPR